MRLPVIKHIVSIIENNDEDYVVETLETLEDLIDFDSLKDQEIERSRIQQKITKQHQQQKKLQRQFDAKKREVEDQTHQANLHHVEKAWNQFTTRLVSQSLMEFRGIEQKILDSFQLFWTKEVEGCVAQHKDQLQQLRIQLNQAPQDVARQKSTLQSTLVLLKQAHLYLDQGKLDQVPSLFTHLDVHDED